MTLSALLMLALLAPAGRADDPIAVARKLLETGSALFDAKDAASLAATYTEDAEVVAYSVEESGQVKTEVRRGRAEIEKIYSDLFRGDSSFRTRNDVEYATFAGEHLLIIGGKFTLNTGSEPIPFIQVRVKQGDRWLMKNLQLFPSR